MVHLAKYMPCLQPIQGFNAHLRYYGIIQSSNEAVYSGELKLCPYIDSCTETTSLPTHSFSSSLNKINVSMHTGHNKRAAMYI